jgi:polyhydroxyalkanoate synthesis regulator phasin
MAERSTTKKKASSKKKKAAPKKKARAEKRPSRKPASVEAKTVAEFRDALRKPGGMVLVTRDRIEEALEGAVKEGQLSAKQARGIAKDLVKRGRKETNHVLKDLENLLDRGRDRIEKRASRARKTASPVLARADRARRAAGVGASFPISGYDELTVPEVKNRLGSLTPAELRKVRDYERRHGKRKGVLTAVEAKLK